MKNKITNNNDTKAITKPNCPLIGENGNIYNLMGIASRTLKRNGMADEATEMINRITKGAESYDEALCIIGEYVNITSKGDEDLEESDDDYEYEFVEDDGSEEDEPIDEPIDDGDGDIGMGGI